MTPEKWQQVKDLFSRALDCEPEDRARFLAAACSDDAVRAEVERLVAAHERTSAFLDGSLTPSEVSKTSEPDLTGTTLFQYEIREQLGVGGGGRVYKAWDSQLERLVAIKFLPNDATTTPQEQSNLVKEAKAASALNHPNVITIYQTGYADGRSFIAMELVTGETLADLMQRRRLSVAEALKYASQIAEALRTAHDAGIVHLDLKPSNVMLRNDGLIKVLDFGLARRRRTVSSESQGNAASDDSHTAEAVVAGTVPYMSPEQAEGNPVDKSSDIFSLGIIIYEMITGERPFRGSSPISTLAAIIKEDPKLMRKSGAKIPAELEVVVRRALEKSPAQRFQDMAELKAALDKLSIRDKASPRLTPWVLAASVLGVVLLLLSALLWNWSGSRPDSRIFKESIIAAEFGEYVSPSLFPDGSRVAYAFKADKDDNFDIYVKQVGPADPLRLTRDPAADLWPAVSPDGTQVAFVRIVAGFRAALMVMPSLPGPERKIADLQTVLPDPPGWMATLLGPVLSWSRDGKYIVASDREGRTGPLFLFSVETGEKRRLTAPGDESYLGDLEASFSPDGRALVFTRYLGLGNGQLFRLELTPDLTPAGDPVRIETRTPGAHSASWSPDGNSLLFSSGWLYQMGLWRIDSRGRGTAQQVATPAATAYWPQVNAKTQRLVYVKSERDVNTMEVALDGAGHAAGKPTRMLGSSRNVSSLEYQPNGNLVAFFSNRRGPLELWVSDSDGSNTAPIVNAPEHPVGGPAWSMDGRRLFYLANDDGNINLYAINPDGGEKRRVATQLGFPLSPQWSGDGKSAYFTSTLSGRPEIWKVSLDGGKPEQVASNGAIFLQLSPDGRTAYYTKSGMSTELWKMALEGGMEEQVFATSDKPFHTFTVTSQGVYFASNLRSATDGATIYFFNFATGETSVVLHSDQPVFIALSVSSDSRKLAYSAIDRTISSLIGIENFQ